MILVIVVLFMNHILQVFEYEPILALEYFYMAAERGHLEACYQVLANPQLLRGLL